MDVLFLLQERYTYNKNEIQMVLIIMVPIRVPLQLRRF